MSNSKLKSINKAALWEQWIGKAAYVSDKYPANNWQACEILDVVESGLKLRVIDNATHPRPEMPKKRKRGGRKRKWDKRNAPESLIAIPWESVNSGNRVKLANAFKPVEVSGDEIGYHGNNPERLGPCGIKVWGKSLWEDKTRRMGANSRFRVRFLYEFSRGRKRQTLNIPGATSFESASRLADVCIKEWIEMPIRNRKKNAATTAQTPAKRRAAPTISPVMLKTKGLVKEMEQLFNEIVTQDPSFAFEFSHKPQAGACVKATRRNSAVGKLINLKNICKHHHMHNNNRVDRTPEGERRQQNTERTTRQKKRQKKMHMRERRAREALAKQVQKDGKRAWYIENRTQLRLTEATLYTDATVTLLKYLKGQAPLQNLLMVSSGADSDGVSEWVKPPQLSLEQARKEESKAFGRRGRKIADDDPEPITMSMAQTSRLQKQLFAVYQYVKLRMKRCDLLLSDDYLQSSLSDFEDDHANLTVPAIIETAQEEAGVGNRQLREYVKQYFQFGGFLPDGRARDASTWIAQNPMEKLQLSNWLKCRKHNSKEETRNFINNTLFKDVPNGTVICKATGLQKPISHSTALNWMTECGLRYVKREKCYFTDRHDHYDTVMDRVDAYHRDMFIQLREPLWYAMSNSDKLRYAEQAKNVKQSDGTVVSTWPSDSDATRIPVTHVEESEFYSPTQLSDRTDWWEYHVDQLPESMRKDINDWGGKPTLRRMYYDLPCAAPAHDDPEEQDRLCVQYLKDILVSKSPVLHVLLIRQINKCWAALNAFTGANSILEAELLSDLKRAQDEWAKVDAAVKLDKKNATNQDVDLSDKLSDFFGDTPSDRRKNCWQAHNRCIFRHNVNECKCHKGVDVYRAASLDYQCLFNHEPGNCLCNRPVIRFGQDESIFYSNMRTAAYWKYKNQIQMEPKTNGVACHVSATTAEIGGFGLPLTAADRDAINRSRANEESVVTGKKKMPIPADKSPGVVMINPKNGLWKLNGLARQAEDVLDCYRHLLPTWQVVGSYDNSMAHSKKDDDGLLASKMAVGYGGKQRRLRRIRLLPGCIGPYRAKMWKRPDGSWVPRGATVPQDAIAVDCLLKEGDWQECVFKDGDPPPFLKVDASPHAFEKTDAEKLKFNAALKKKRLIFVTKRREQEADPEYQLTADEEAQFEVPPPLHEGWLGSAKGMAQMAWETGWYPPDRKLSKTQLLEIFKVRPDFLAETSSLANVFINRGHGFVLSVKCHPEMAGKGIEYCWGKGKYEFRRNINTRTTHWDTLARSVNTALGSKPFHPHWWEGDRLHEAPLPLRRVRAFARRARLYRSSYGKYRTLKAIKEAAGTNSTTFALIESICKESKRHRCTMDEDYSFIVSN